MKSFYKIRVSEQKENEGINPDFTLATKYRSFDRACKEAREWHKENRDVTVFELCSLGVVSMYSLKAGENLMIFSCNDELAQQVGET